MFDRATIRLGIGPHSSVISNTLLQRSCDVSDRNVEFDDDKTMSVEDGRPASTQHDVHTASPPSRTCTLYYSVITCKLRVD